MCYAGIVEFFAGLLVVCHKMLQTCADFVLLDCANQVSRKFACQHWVFREVLKIASAKRVAHNVDARCQDDVDTVGFCLVGHAFALQRGSVDVPSGGKSGG